MRGVGRTRAVRWFACLALGGTALVGAPNLALGQGNAAHACVNPQGSDGCFNSISAAVAAVQGGGSVDVAAGTYKEQVTIDKALVLRGAGASSTTIDAAGLPHGIAVTNASSVVRGVVIQGFTIQDANFGGVLFGNAESVTFRNNTVVNNDKGLTMTASGPTCPGIPFAFDEMDCGEGITIAGLSNSLLADNDIEHNAGGILVSDELAPTHDNTFLRNTVSNNVADCGMTLASHHPGNQVYANTIVQNTVSNNGAAGVGLFAPIPGTGSHDNVILNNTLTGNGLPGVTLHSHAPGQNVNNNAIIGNTISGNGPDFGATFVPTGISLNTAPKALPMTGARVLNNSITGEAVDLFVGFTNSSVEVHFNTLGAPAIGIRNAGSGTISAQLNYWGCPTGPNTAGCSTTSGASIDTLPFLRFAPR